MNCVVEKSLADLVGTSVRIASKTGEQIRMQGDTRVSVQTYGGKKQAFVAQHNSCYYLINKRRDLFFIYARTCSPDAKLDFYDDDNEQFFVATYSKWIVRPWHTQLHQEFTKQHP